MALRREVQRVPRHMAWDGTPERAAKIAEWARNAALLPRWQWNPGDEFARVLVERAYPDSAEWVAVPVGSIIRRTPPHPPAPGEVPGKSEEADWPLEVQPPEE